MRHLSVVAWLANRDGTPPSSLRCAVVVAVWVWRRCGCVAEQVEIDCLSGDMMLLRTDLCMDVGQSLNPAIDVGQVEGGFVQGLGWVALEELKWGDAEHRWIPPGHLFTRGPGAYKIPSVNDIPIDFRVSLLNSSANPRAVFSSKAVGEPPLLLANSVFFAIKDAVKAARLAAGVTLHGGYVEMDAPATPERIRLACADAHTAPFEQRGGAGIRAKLSV